MTAAATGTPTEAPTEAGSIELVDVWVQYRLRHAHHYNAKRALTNALRGRREDGEVITALAGVSLRVGRGARIGLIGANGAGKSTLLAVMAGLLTPTRGSALTRGRVLALLGGPTQGLDPEQTGRENAVALGVQLGASPAFMDGQLDGIREFSGLGRRFDHPVHTYSAGMQVRLRFSAITCLDADVLLMDEGIGAADAEFTTRADDRLRAFFARSGTLILATHNEELLTQHCTEFLQLARGAVRPGARSATWHQPPRPPAGATNGRP